MIKLRLHSVFKVQYLSKFIFKESIRVFFSWELHHLTFLLKVIKSKFMLKIVHTFDFNVWNQNECKDIKIFKCVDKYRLIINSSNIIK